jgi:hypothetical protein
MTDVGDQPRPQIEPGEPAPGGVDALFDALYEPDPVVPDLATALHPDLHVPGPVAEGEDTDEGATTDGASEPEKESPA